ncbi:MetQ/NlpA family ABC transporter substrate-binding protein [Psittacicella gerlachiana]|uniref:Lipoprotein n=1 Tax=Psittacicella gerlachiana TaxID=2028574 RepID=A0A3A1Y9E9_9GAMM|nr:MetQ/NlpA family ABC transporter substrate-binding protein [Psittacicella gerlachiana]RIY34305.1 methionine ABC transporter substrate-binding protein [Psittacicella gerlachiana]
MKFYKVFTTLALGAATLTSAYANQKLVVAATPVPHAEILEFVKPILAKQGIDLEVKVFTDYVLPNRAVSTGEADANFYQHQPYLDAYNQQYKTDIIGGFKVHIEPFGIYSTKYKSLNDIPRGATFVLPNDPSNEGRALLVLQSAGLIKLKDPTKLLSTERDIAENPNRYKFLPVEAANIPRVYKSADFGLINANYALTSGLSPSKDALYIEHSGPYANFIAYRKVNENDPRIKALENALNSKEVYDFILTKYNGGVIPVFKPEGVN